MAVAAANNQHSKETPFDRYVGERKGQIRHGQGEYQYRNKYFKYEGEWENGYKHGHGKLLMGDGGYYEGVFQRGEIVGHGYRVFGLTGNTYTGQFHMGELHGHGLFISKDGCQYEGGWMHNKREGEGILTESDGSVFEGEFHNHKKHGQGMQTDSNGDYYEGDWINGVRHGQGIQRYHDGTVYEGQWKADVYHGEGSLLHASGFRYHGLWSNGRPTEEAIGLVLANETKVPLVIEQGKTFTIAINCVNEKGEIVCADNGRTFKITAFIDRKVVRKNTSKPSFAALMKETKTLIPYGDVIPYELLQVQQLETYTTSESTTPKGSSEINLTQEEMETTDTNKGNLHIASMSPSIIEKSQNPTDVLNLGLSSPATKSMIMNKQQPEVTEEEKFLAALVSTSTAKSNDGRIEFKDLYIPPPPAPKLNSVLEKASSKLHITLSVETITPKVSNQGIKSPKPPRSPVGSRSTSPSRSPRQHQISETTSKKNITSKGNMKRKQNDKEKLLQVKRERFCAPGTYILLVTEVTTPPFLNERLPSLFIEVNVISQRIGKESSLDRLVKSRSRTKTVLTPDLK